MGMSDPFAVVTVRGDNQNNKPRVVGQSDVYVLCVCVCVFMCSLCVFVVLSPSVLVCVFWPSLKLDLILLWIRTPDTFASLSLFLPWRFLFYSH
jgi:hypothetical protein